MSLAPGPDAVMQQLLYAAQAMGHGGTAPKDAAPSADTPPAMLALQQEWLAQHAELWQAMLKGRSGEARTPFIGTAATDKRFADPAWSDSPVYDYLRQAYLINADYLRRVVELLPMRQGRARERLRFLVKQYIDAMAPSNYFATNPEFISLALRTKGQSIRHGIENLIRDLGKGRISMTDESAFEVGRNLAITPGDVVFENELFQLIQYAPTTGKVAQRPLLIVPPCINKYYILDLQPQNSFVRFAVAQGFTVFMMSWRNVRGELGGLGWDDYVASGVLEALHVTRAICAVEQVNALGFCVGGTLLACALAVAKARGDDPVKSLTLLTTLLDFAESGELACLVDETMLRSREAAIGKGGIFPAREFATVFSSLRPNDLIWQYVVGNYLKGKQPPAFDLLHWNSDSTNLPGPFLVWYLRNMYHENRLREPGRLSVCGVKVDLRKVDMPAFVLAAREDHIVPWQAAFASRGLLGGKSRFVLAASGHIAGVVNPPESRRRSHWIGKDDEVDAESWLDGVQELEGSWWPHWSDWLNGYGGKQVAARRAPGNAKHRPIEPAPGRYVAEKA